MKAFLDLLFRIARVIFFVAGSICLITSIILAIRTSSFKRSAQSTTGTVVSLVAKTTTDVSTKASSIAYYPEFRFQTPEGFQHLVVSGTGSNPAGFHVGDPVDVLYLPGQPDSARISTFAQLWLAPLVVSILGVAQLIVGFVLTYFIRKRRLAQTAPFPAYYPNMPPPPHAP